MTLLVSMGAFAQGNGIGGITEATNMVTSYFDPGTKLIYAIGAVIGLIGGVKVYSKFSSGGNSHVRFLEGKAPVRGLTYSTRQATRIPQRLPPAGSVRVSS